MAVRSVQTAHCSNAEHRLAPLDVHGPGHLRTEHVSPRPTVSTTRSHYDASLDPKLSGAESTRNRGTRRTPGGEWPPGESKGFGHAFIDGPPSPEEEPLKSRIRHPGEQPRRLPTPVVLPNTKSIALVTSSTAWPAKNAVNTLPCGVARTSRRTIGVAFELSMRSTR